MAEQTWRPFVKVTAKELLDRTVLVGMDPVKIAKALKAVGEAMVRSGLDRQEAVVVLEQNLSLLR